MLKVNHLYGFGAGDFIVPVTLVFQATLGENVASGTYTVPSKRSMVVICTAAQTNPVTAVSSVTISGHAATNIVEVAGGGGTVSCASIWAAMVDPGDANTWAVVQNNVVGGRRGGAIYTSDATQINAPHTGTSVGFATSFSKTLDVGKGGGYLASAFQLVSSGHNTAAWTLLTEDSDYGAGLGTYSTAHKNYVEAAASQAAQVDFSGGGATPQGAVAWAVFEP